jgi:hypothetical protein
MKLHLFVLLFYFVHTRALHSLEYVHGAWSMNIIHIKVNVFVVECSLQIFYMMKIDTHISNFFDHSNE